MLLISFVSARVFDSTLVSFQFKNELMMIYLSLKVFLKQYTYSVMHHVKYYLLTLYYNVGICIYITPP